MKNGVTVASMNKAKEELMNLAAKKNLFENDFLPPDQGEIYRTFLIYQDDNGEYSLYVNASLPGQESPPHDHGGSWAIVVAVKGEELHRVYKANPDLTEVQSQPIQLANEILVKPGSAISLLPEGIHSIHANSDEPLLHLHLYGKGFEFQGERNEYDLESGAVKRFKLDDISVIEDAR